MTQTDDSWAAGSTYEQFMGRWSKLLAAEFVRWMDAPAGLNWLDVGCGTGSLAKAICDLTDPMSVTACDPSEPFIEFARAENSDARIDFKVGGIGSLPTGPDGFAYVTSSLAMNFFPDAKMGVAEMCSVATDGGTVSLCVWDYAEGMGFLHAFWDSAVRLDPAASKLDEGVRFPICRREPLEDLFTLVELSGVVCEAIEIDTKFANIEDLWQPFLGGTGPAPAYLASLDDDRKEILRDSIYDSLAVSPDGSIDLKARAWAVKGKKDN